MIYRLQYDRYQYLAPDISPLELKKKFGDPFILSSNDLWESFWVPIDIKFNDLSDIGNVVNPPDISVWFTDELVFNKKAYDALKNTLNGYGEFLPISCEGKPYWLMHVTKTTGLDAVNLHSSKREIDPTGFAEVENITFIEDKVKDLLVFKSGFSQNHNIFCSQKFKDAVLSARLNGLIFNSNLGSSPP